jgi:hypothetical protein
MQFAHRSQLPLSDHVHELDAGECRRSRTKGLEPERRSCFPLDCSVILFDDVVQIFPPPDFDARLMPRVVARDRRRVGAALIEFL